MKAAILEKYASDGRELIVRDIPIPVIADERCLSRSWRRQSIRSIT